MDFYIRSHLLPPPSPFYSKMPVLLVSFLIAAKVGPALAWEVLSIGLEHSEMWAASEICGSMEVVGRPKLGRAVIFHKEAQQIIEYFARR